MSLNKCGKCGKEYTFEERLALKKIKMVEDDPDPMKNYGYTRVCTCGYVFHKNKWGLQDNFEIEVFKDHKTETLKGKVSTVFLELDHGFDGKHLWYETMVFAEGAECYFQERYETKKEAKQGHTKILKALMSGNYKLEPHEWLLSINVE